VGGQDIKATVDSFAAFPAPKTKIKGSISEAFGNKQVVARPRPAPVCARAALRGKTLRSSQYGGRDETCPISTEGGTRRVHSVREGGGGGSVGILRTLLS